MDCNGNNMYYPFKETCGKRYVGSRYVPKLEGLHDVNKEYEALSIVVDIDNNSYTSKKNVPAGINLSNTDYWVQTSNYSGLVKDVDDKVNVLRGDFNNHVTLNDAEFNAIQLELIDIKGKDVIQDSKIQENTDDITALKNTDNGLDLRLKVVEFNTPTSKYIAYGSPMTVIQSDWIDISDGYYSIDIGMLLKSPLTFHSMKLEVVIYNGEFIINEINKFTSDLEAIKIEKYEIQKSVDNNSYCIKFTMVTPIAPTLMTSYQIISNF